MCKSGLPSGHWDFSGVDISLLWGCDITVGEVPPLISPSNICKNIHLVNKNIEKGIKYNLDITMIYIPDDFLTSPRFLLLSPQTQSSQFHYSCFAYIVYEYLPKKEHSPKIQNIIRFWFADNNYKSVPKLWPIYWIFIPVLKLLEGYNFL